MRSRALTASAGSTLLVTSRLLGVGLLLAELGRTGRDDDGALHFTSLWHTTDLGLFYAIAPTCDVSQATESGLLNRFRLKTASSGR